MRPKYLCFTHDHNLDAALQTFRDRYHLEPKEHKLEHGILWIGPIPGSDLIYFEEPGILNIEISGQNNDKMQLIMF